ncbi:MAG: hypothetical protein SFV54_14765 [Bryobacteraceae bacterium]|nr:hypothetical protein [Bryobacteraceae bacterium]
MPRYHIHSRPLLEGERLDLRRQALEAERFMLEAHRRAVRAAALRGFAVAVVLALVWWVTIARDADRAKSLAATAGSLAVYLLFTCWDLLEAWKRVTAIRSAWSETIRRSEAAPVIELSVEPLRAWNTGFSWLLDAGEGWGLLLDPEGRDEIPERMVIRQTASGIVWTDYEGAPAPHTTLDFDWGTLPDDHPLLESCGPALFRLGPDPAASILAFEDGRFPLGASPRNS